MTKQKNLMSLIIVALFVFLLSGCGANKTSVYTLPLGDSGYISEMDFKTKNSYAYSYDTEGRAKEWVSYNYSEVGESYKVDIRFGKNSVEGKNVILKAGYYDDNNDFIEIASSSYIKLSTTEFSTGSIEYTTTTNNTIVKLVFGTNVDEAKIKEEDPNIKKSALNKALKQYRGSSVIIQALTITKSGEATANSILSEEVVNINDVATGTRVGSVSTDLRYYNTANVSYDATSDSLTLSLNYKGGPWQWIVGVIAKFLYWVVGLVGGQYWLGLLIVTIIIRTLGWPIYAKSNSMTSRMSEVQPEIDKINKKYEGKTDQNSMMKKQMETREVMKKNHVSMWGCFLPILQMPIFLWVYQVVQRFPITPLYEAGTNYKFLWTTFATNYGQATGDIPLAIIVGLTMLASQELSNIMSKRINKKKENFYTQNKAKQSNMQMRIMMFMMTAMMVWFAWRSAGIAFYWIIGNLYQILQTFISKKQEEKRAEKQRQLSGKPRGRS